MAKSSFKGIAFQPISRRAFLVSSGAAAIGVAFGSAAWLVTANRDS